MEQPDWLSIPSLEKALNDACRNTDIAVVHEIEKTGKIPDEHKGSTVYQHILALHSQIQALNGVPGYTMWMPV